MDNPSPPIFCIIFLIAFYPLLKAQQPYIDQDYFQDCDDIDNRSLKALGYSCNGMSQSCQAYLTFRSQLPYDSISSLTKLLGSDPSLLSRINKVSVNATLPPSWLAFVPVNCSCSNGYYQANTSYVVQNGDSPFSIANATYQGLSTCQALTQQNRDILMFESQKREIPPGLELAVPLRCACPTRSQISNGVKYLLSYILGPDDYVELLAKMFGVESQSIVNANRLNSILDTLYTATTLLIPLWSTPSHAKLLASPPLSSPPLSAPPPSPQPPSSSSSHDKSKRRRIYVSTGVAVGGLVLALATVFFVVMRKRKRADHPARIMAMPRRIFGSGPSGEFRLSLSDFDSGIKVYPFEALQGATNNFSPSSHIKGSVYCGFIDGELVAIKKMSQLVTVELDILRKINHFNLIRLLAISHNQGHWYFVYEYAENGTLSDLLRGQIWPNTLNWMQRVQIGLDVASGLNYLHSYVLPAHVHHDIKSSSILLDGNFRGKISSLAMARTKQGSSVITRNIRGTRGYLAPEYVEKGEVSPKTDVYAFGVVMLEILTGKEAIVSVGEGDKLLSESFLAELGEDNDEAEMLKKLLDPSLKANYPFDVALALIRLIKECLSYDASSRPSMDKIMLCLVHMLTASLTSEPTSNSSQAPTSALHKTSVLRGEPSICFDESFVSAKAEKFKYCLVGMFAGPAPILPRVRAWASAEWDFKGEWSVTQLDLHHVFIRLDNEQDMQEVRTTDEWLVEGVHKMKVTEWTPEFQAGVTGGPSTALVWIEFPFLPIVFFQEELLLPIATSVGRVLSIDEGTRSLSQTHSARVCVELNLSEEPPSRVWVGTGEDGFWQEVHYQNLPPYCLKCHRKYNIMQI